MRLASRTDAGVSALGNVAAFDTAFPPEGIVGAFNSTARDVVATGFAEAPEGFDPRHARSRWYRYLLSGDHELAALQEHAALFVGEHDFASFCREAGESVRVLNAVEVGASGSFTAVDVRAQGFLWNMVRRIVAALVALETEAAARDNVAAALRGERQATLGQMESWALEYAMTGRRVGGGLPSMEIYDTAAASGAKLPEWLRTRSFSGVVQRDKQPLLVAARQFSLGGDATRGVVLVQPLDKHWTDALYEKSKMIVRTARAEAQGQRGNIDIEANSEFGDVFAGNVGTKIIWGDLVEFADWQTGKTDTDLARAYVAWGGYAYGNGADGIGKRDRVLEVFELVRSVQLGNAVFGNNPPIGNLGLKRFDFISRHRRGADAASLAFLFG